MRRGELVLLSRAIRGRWPIPDELKLMLVEEAARIALGVTGDNARTRVGAMRAIIAMDQINLAHEQFMRDLALQNRVEELEKVAHELEGGPAGANVPAGETVPEHRAGPGG